MTDETDIDTPVPEAPQPRRKKRAAEPATEPVVEAAIEIAVETDPLDAVLETMPEPEVAPAELHECATIIAAARSLFEVAPEIMAGAMCGAGIETTSQVTVEQARAALDTYLTTSV